MKKIALVLAGLLVSSQVFATPSLTCPSDTANSGSPAPAGWEIWGNTGTQPGTYKLAGAISTVVEKSRGLCVYSVDGNFPKPGDNNLVLVSDRTDLRKGDGSWTVSPSDPSHVVCTSNTIYGCTFGLLP